MSVTDLLLRCRESQVVVRCVDNNLNVTALGGKVPETLLADLRARKFEIVAYLNAGSHNDDFQNIPLAAKQEYYDVSPAQRRMWLWHQLAEAPVAYNMPASYRIRGLDVNALAAAFADLAARHEILRTTFHRVGDAVKQKIHSVAEVNFSVCVEDFRECPDREQKAKAIAQEESLTVFDLATGPLFKVKVLRMDGETVILLMTTHHIVSDGWSNKVLYSELMRRYAAHVANETRTWTPLKIQYKDYVAWKNNQLLSGQGAEKAYWLQKLRGNIPVLSLPGMKTRPGIQTFRGDAIDYVVPKNIMLGLKRIAREEQASLFMTILAGIITVLYTHTGQTDVIVGTPTAGRDHADLEDQVGLYTSMLPLRTRFRHDDSFAQLVHRVKATALEAFEHQRYPLDKLVEALPLARDTTRSPVFDVIVALQNIDLNAPAGFANALSAQPASEVTIQPYECKRNTSKFDLAFTFYEKEYGLSLSLQYNTDVYDYAYVNLVWWHFLKILEFVVADSTVRLNALHVVSDHDREFAMTTRHATQAETAKPVQSDAVFTAPRNQLEAMLAQVWQDILNTAGMSIHDNIFLLGATSMEVVAAADIIQKSTGVVFHARTAYCCPTIATIAGFLQQQLPAVARS
ncbi:condensation domain-containing protein [Chryseolinea lacunae]|uniref:Carrier domain-containing protein n=1 Tax=Chryseolinea lacunae TaxID=2801331 RepID=A0ABS1KUG8_9BACT|nr:condensation domain-containing protein [Chryseolinea lacunae]MBL0743064.1 hypothetical protein [Chryseolinea lacunae]